MRNPSVVVSRMMRMIRGIGAATALACIVLTACTGGGPQPSPTQGSPKGVAVPNVVGLTTTAADRTLQTERLLLEVNPTGTPVGNQPDGLVVSQKPAGGARVSRGSVVTVDALCTPKPCPSPIGGQVIYDPCTCATR